MGTLPQFVHFRKSFFTEKSTLRTGLSLNSTGTEGDVPPTRYSDCGIAPRIITLSPETRTSTAGGGTTKSQRVFIAFRIFMQATHWSVIIVLDRSQNTTKYPVFFQKTKTIQSSNEHLESFEVASNASCSTLNANSNNGKCVKIDYKK